MAHLTQSDNTLFDADSQYTPEVGYEPARRVTKEASKAIKRSVSETEGELIKKNLV